VYFLLDPPAERDVEWVADECVDCRSWHFCCDSEVHVLHCGGLGTRVSVRCEISGLGGFAQRWPSCSNGR
jgi:hypothetical protein